MAVLPLLTTRRLEPTICEFLRSRSRCGDRQVRGSSSHITCVPQALCADSGWGGVACEIL